MKTLKLEIENIKCRGCANTIRNEIEKSDSVKDVKVDVGQGIVEISYENDLDLKSSFVRKLTKLGYPEKGKGTGFNKARSYISCAIGKIKKN